MEKGNEPTNEGTQCSTETSCSTCGSESACDAATQQAHMEDRLANRLSQIKHRIAVMSGKGGVGKTTVAVNLAVGLAEMGKRVGILDGDVHGPNVPKMFGLDGLHPEAGPTGLLPLDTAQNVRVMSMAFLIPDPDTPVAWRGPMKHSLFQQFLADVDWGPMDYLIIDLPPGTGDEPLSVGQLMGKPLWTIIVTTPQDVALLDARKSVNFGRNLNMNVLGMIENMSGLECPHCGGRIDLFKTGGGEKSARELGVPFLGSIPLDPAIVLAGDTGIPLTSFTPESISANTYRNLARTVDGVITNDSQGS